ncbi:MAG: RHS repeat-associated core domain-containing protein [Clostridia bacterium]|nr:RHS repeat-associated core domain-containing protein [Clostridia bacterium]
MRVQKTVGGVTHTYTYLGDRLVCEEWGSCYIYYIYDETGRPYGLIYCDGTNTDNYYFLRNLQGDVLELMEMNGETVAFYEYDPWGKVLSVKDASGNAITSATHIANVNPIRYRGYYYDTESGFYYLRSRYYDPEVCRFISADDWLEVGLYNLFVYCGNNPTNCIDPLGTSFWSVLKQVGKTFVKAAIIVGGAASIGITIGAAITGTIGSGGIGGVVAIPAAIAITAEIVTEVTIAVATVGAASIITGEIGEEIEQSSPTPKGKSFRGGSKKQRDKWYGYNDKGFQKWFERVGKKRFNYNFDIESREEAEELYKLWLELGKPFPD